MQRFRGRPHCFSIFRFRACEIRFGEGIASNRLSRAREEGYGGEDRVQGGRLFGHKETRKRRGTEAEEKRKGEGAGDDARTSCASFLRASALKREANSSLGKF